jgi:hypothetical protein
MLYRTTRNVKTVMNCEQAGVWKEAVAIYFKLQSKHLTAEIEEITHNSQDNW